MMLRFHHKLDEVQDYLDIESFRRQHLLSHSKVYSIHVDSEPEYFHKQVSFIQRHEQRVKTFFRTFQ